MPLLDIGLYVANFVKRTHFLVDLGYVPVENCHRVNFMMDVVWGLVPNILSIHTRKILLSFEKVYNLFLVLLNPNLPKSSKILCMLLYDLEDSG